MPPIDPVLFIAGFVVGAGCIVMLGVSLLDDYHRKFVLPATVAGALACGLVLGWSFNYFLHWAQR
jgi:hypothetical protein